MELIPDPYGSLPLYFGHPSTRAVNSGSGNRAFGAESEAREEPTV